MASGLASQLLFTADQFRIYSPLCLNAVVEVTDKKGQKSIGLFGGRLIDLRSSLEIYRVSRLEQRSNGISLHCHLAPADSIQTIQVLGANLNEWLKTLNASYLIAEQLKAYPPNTQLAIDILKGTYQSSQPPQALDQPMEEGEFRKIADSHLNAVVEIQDKAGRVFSGILTSPFTKFISNFAGYSIQRLSVLDRAVNRTFLYNHVSYRAIAAIRIVAPSLDHWTQFYPKAPTIVEKQMGVHPVACPFLIKSISSRGMAPPSDPTKGTVKKHEFAVCAMEHVKKIVRFDLGSDRIVTGHLKAVFYDPLRNQRIYYVFRLVVDRENRVRYGYTHAVRSNDIQGVQVLSLDVPTLISQDSNLSKTIAEELRQYPWDSASCSKLHLHYQEWISAQQLLPAPQA